MHKTYSDTCIYAICLIYNNNKELGTKIWESMVNYLQQFDTFVSYVSYRIARATVFSFRMQ